jgi:hypothetical protein
MRVPSGCGYDFSTPTASMIASLTLRPRTFYTRSAQKTRPL